MPRAVVATAGEAVPVHVWLLSIAVALQFMSGQSDQFGLPLSPDRLLLPVAVVLLWRHERARGTSWRLVPLHALMAVSCLWVVASLVHFEGLGSSVALFNLLDAFGVVPFLLFLIAPTAYSTRRRRRTLLVTLTALGLYLGFTALVQGLRVESLVFPRYIVDATSSHFGRAFGPSLQVGSNGLQLFGCLGCAVILAATSRGWVRWTSSLVALLCGLGLLFTMTRSIWLGSLLGVICAMSLSATTRRWIIRGCVAAAVTVVAILLLNPTLQATFQARLDDSQSGFDRLNAAHAALRVLEDRPLFGIGFSQFADKEADWFWQGDTTPVAATGIAVHNVLLGLAAELGIIGMALWLVTLIVASKGLWREMPRDVEARLWRQVTLGYAVCWVAVGMLLPISYALPSSMLWVFLGVISRPADVGCRRPTAPASGLPVRVVP